MADNERDDPIFKNADTVRRREWIDRALAGVREQLGAGSQASASPDPARRRSRRPRLYVVPGDKSG